MKKRQPAPDPEIIRLENHLEPDWRFRVNLTEADARRLAEGIVPEWLQRNAEWWCRDNAKPSDVSPDSQTHAADAAALEKSA